VSIIANQSEFLENQTMLGSLIGDIVGSAYEFSNFKGKDFAPLFHPKARFTDDTVCTVAVADALTRGSHPQATLIEWCKRYAENGGWGKQFAMWFLDDNPQPYGSWGNGAAMHTAQAVALAIFWARRHVPATDIGLRLTDRFGYPLHLTPDDIRPTYKRTEKAIDSVPQAISCALHANSFEDAIRNAVSLGGDSDTIAAIAGGISEALHGIPKDIAVQAWAYLPQDMQAVMRTLYIEADSGPVF
jgi:ADP-ribosylglycohydrolase